MVLDIQVFLYADFPVVSGWFVSYNLQAGLIFASGILNPAVPLSVFMSGDKSGRMAIYIFILEPNDRDIFHDGFCRFLLGCRQTYTPSCTSKFWCCRSGFLSGYLFGCLKSAHRGTAAQTDLPSGYSGSAVHLQINFAVRVLMFSLSYTNSPTVAIPVKSMFWGYAPLLLPVAFDFEAEEESGKNSLASHLVRYDVYISVITASFDNTYPITFSSFPLMSKSLLPILATHCGTSIYWGVNSATGLLTKTGFGTSSRHIQCRLRRCFPQLVHFDNA